MKDKYKGTEYDSKWDSYYNPTTGEWVEDKCDDVGCGFCSNRPSWATPTTDANIDGRIEAWHVKDFGKEPEQPLVEFLGLTWDQFSHFVMKNKIP